MAATAKSFPAIGPWEIWTRNVLSVGVEAFAMLFGTMGYSHGLDLGLLECNTSGQVRSGQAAIAKQA